MTVRVRFAPSPTGYLHIGGARTALFNWLFARHEKGAFILRIEDTDRERSTDEAIACVIEDLKWLELFWDEGPEVGGPYGPYFQSKRIDTYQNHAQKLIEENKAYYCFCTPDELEKKRKIAMAEKRAYKYDGTCRNLTLTQRKKLESGARKKVIRFKIPPTGKTVFEDIIKGEIEFINALLDDFIIIKSDGLPTYNFAAVVDDNLMKITHIIRGDDHISNTPRQILLYQAFGFPIPQFAHMSLTMGTDGARLSKRHGATSIGEYRKMGYLPEALRNYIALLGWATSDTQEIFTTQEMVEKFSLADVGKSSNVFDFDKLNWMNGEYIRMANLDKLTDLVIPFLKEKGYLSEKIDKKEYEYVKKIVSLEQERMKVLSELPELADFFFKDEIGYDLEAVNKILKKDYIPELLKKLSDNLKKIELFSAQNIEKMMRAVAEEIDLKTSQVFHPLRVAISGKMAGPGLFEICEVLGKEKVLSRIEKVLRII